MYNQDYHQQEVLLTLYNQGPLASPSEVHSSIRTPRYKIIISNWHLAQGGQQDVCVGGLVCARYEREGGGA